MKPEVDEIQAKVGTVDPEVEVLAVETPGSGSLRLLIDHPEGVTLDTCRKVTDVLGELREQYSLEVSSPGPKRPLTRPEHFRRFAGRKAKIRTTEDIESRRTFTGTIIGTDGEGVTLGLDEMVVSIPFEVIDKAHLVPGKRNATRSE